MKDKPLVSIIMPIYNAEEYLSQTLDSLLSQSFLDWELFAVDDCSRDNSRKILDRYANKDNRIHVIKKIKNSGSADSRNQGIQLSEGRYIAFLDADDLWDSDFLNNMINFMGLVNSPFSFSSYRIVDEDGIEITKPFLISKEKYSLFDILLFNRVGLLTAIYDSEIIGKMYFDTSLKSLRDDYALWIDILKKIKYGYGHPKIMASYRVRKNAMTSNKKRAILAHFFMLKNHAELNFLSSIFFTMTHSIMGIRKYIFNKV